MIHERQKPARAVFSLPRKSPTIADSDGDNELSQTATGIIAIETRTPLA